MGERRLYWLLSDGNTTELRAMSWSDSVVATAARYQHQAGEQVWFTPVEAGATVYLVAHRDAGVTGPDRLEQTTSTYRIDTGTLVPVANSTGWWPAGGPWLRASRFASGRPAPGVASPTPVRTPQFWNLATGERRTPLVPPGFTALSYGPERTVARRDGVLVSYRYDGSDAIALTGPDGDYTLTMGDDLPDRFATVLPVRPGAGDVRYLWDQARHQVGAFNDTVPQFDAAVLDENAQGKTVLDLARIP
jgi:hypothetical protein